MDNKNYKRMDFFQNKEIINKIKKDCVEDGVIDYSIVTIHKEVILICDVAKYITPIIIKNEETLEDEINAIETFKIIRKQRLFDKFKRDFHRDDLYEFEELLKVELLQEAQLQKDENSIENTLIKFLKDLSTKIPDEKTMMKIMNEIKQIDDGKIGNLLKVLGK